MTLQRQAFCVVPQGAHKGPVLFLIYIDVIRVFQHLKYLLFATNCKLIRCVHWPLFAKRYELSIIVIDVAVIVCSQSFSTKVNPTQYVCYLNQVAIKPVTFMKDLGVVLDNELRVDTHINLIANKANGMLGFFKRQMLNFNNLRIQYTNNTDYMIC